MSTAPRGGSPDFLLFRLIGRVKSLQAVPRDVIAGNMRDAGAKFRRYGWLPSGQALIFLISTAGFAVLARVLGPDPYAKFAVILFIFTATSLLVDLSPQGFAIVMGFRKNLLRVTLQLAAISSIAGALILAISVYVANEFLAISPISFIEFLALELALTIQMLTQVPRAVLVLTGRYRAMALIDIVATVCGLVAGLLLAVQLQTMLALIAQLAVTAIARALATLLSLGRNYKSAFTGDGAGVSLHESIAYGIRVIPLNLASYLSRSLDSGILPVILPSAAAAGYARTYQIVIVPITQLQLSLGPAILERLSRGFEIRGSHNLEVSRRLWNLLQTIATVCGVGVVAFSSVIQTVLFGPEWPMVNVMISAMGCLLPALATATYCSWTLQVSSNFRQTSAHLGVMMLTPLIVIVGALLGGAQLALIGLVVGAGLQSVGLVVLHQRIMPGPIGRIVARLLALWLAMAALFVLVATTSAFWSFQF